VREKAQREAKLG